MAAARAVCSFTHIIFGLTRQAFGLVFTMWDEYRPKSCFVSLACVTSASDPGVFPASLAFRAWNRLAPSAKTPGPEALFYKCKRTGNGRAYEKEG